MDSISLYPSLLLKSKLLLEDMDLGYIDVFGLKKVNKIKKGVLSFTYCQVPFIYSLSNANNLTIFKTIGNKMSFNELRIDKNFS